MENLWPLNLMNLHDIHWALGNDMSRLSDEHDMSDVEMKYFPSVSRMVTLPGQDTETRGRLTSSVTFHIH